MYLLSVQNVKGPQPMASDVKRDIKPYKSLHAQKKLKIED